VNPDIQDIKQNTRLIKQSSIESKTNVQILCLVRNGEFYCKHFIEYHRNLGIEKFIFLDNGSNDNTLSILEKYPEVEILQCTLPYKKYWHSFKEFLLYEYGFEKWSLLIDIDEFFDYPLSQYLDIQALIRYLDDENYNSVITQMVDLYPKKDIKAIRLNDDFLSEHKYFQIGTEKTIETDKLTSYTNTISNYSINFKLGGWRDKVFDVGEVLLTKMAFIKYDKKLQYKHDHFVHDALVADISCCLRHYKFSSNFIEYTRESVKRKNHFNDSAEYVKYNDYVNSNKKNLNFYSDGNNILYDFETLLQLDIFVLSSRFRVFFSDIIEKMHKPQIVLLDKNVYKNQSQHFEKLLHLQKLLLDDTREELLAIQNSRIWRFSLFFFINPINKLINAIKKI